MKEIIYIQAGELSNYTGTHFWNTQESYLTHNASDNVTEVGVSFCESNDDDKRSTLCPRLLVIDRKSNFGTLSKWNTLGVQKEMLDDVVPTSWAGNVVEYKQDPIPKSSYQTRMEDQSDDWESLEDGENKPAPKKLDSGVGEVRYWSDYNRVYYLPRTLQKLQDPPEWEASSLDWSQGQEMFTRYNEDSELMDGALRLFVEDCESMQGIQIINDTDTFGSFMSSFLASLRDEYAKLPSFTFALISGAVSESHDVDDIQSIRKLTNEALYLRTLSELSSMNVPIMDPARWPKSVWGKPLNFPASSRYHQSAILSAHIETVTLPFRLRSSREDISSVCSQLNWRGVAPFAELSGVFPVSPFSDLEDVFAVNFSSNLGTKSVNDYARFDVTRGFSLKKAGLFDLWSSKLPAPQSPYTTRVNGPSYPIPSSFPPVEGHTDGFRPQSSRAEAHPSSSAARAVESFSSITSSSNTSKMFEGYALFIDRCVKRRTSAIASMDIIMDDLKDLANDLWTIHDNCSDDDHGFEM